MNLAKITPRADGRRFVAHVEIEAGGEIITADIPASALASLSSFRRALLAATGFWFDSWRYAGRDGAGYWRAHVGALLDAKQPQEATP